MAKAAVTAEELGKLDKVLQAEYEPQARADGLHVMKLEPVAGLSLGEVEKTMQTLSKEREIRAAKEKLLATMVDDEGNPFDPAKTRNAIKKYAEMANWKPDEKVKEQIEAMKLQLEEKYGAERKTLQEQIADLERGLDESVVDAALANAIAKHGANPLLAEVLRDKLKRGRDDKTKKHVARIMDDGDVPKLSPKTGNPIDFDEYFEMLKGQEKFQIFFPGKGVTGPGGLSPARLPAGGSGGGRFRMSNAAAKANPREYMAMREEAAKVGKTVELHD